MEGWWDVEGSVLRVRNVRAVGICRSCPVFEQCRVAADEGEAGKAIVYLGDVILAGETKRQRVARRKRRQAAPVRVARPEAPKAKPSRKQPAARKPKVCLKCGRPMRGAREPLTDHPGTVPRATAGECRTCWGQDPARAERARLKRRKTRQTDVKAA
jgi:hypothetical protein